MSVAIAERAAVGRVLADRELDATLAIAARADGLTFIAMRAPIVAPTAIVAAWPDAPLVAWSSPDGLAIVGVGIARELRGTGVDRWRDVARQAREVRVNGVVVVESTLSFGDGRASRTDVLANATRVADRTPAVDVLGFARPRFLGGGAFAPNAADAPPWTGFGDAWFVLPRWTYVHDGESAWLVLAVDASTARESARRHAELATFRTSFATPADRPRRHITSDDSTSDRSPGTFDGARSLTATHASIDLWRAQVEAITSAIANRACTKIVAARTCSVALSTHGREIGEIKTPATLVASDREIKAPTAALAGSDRAELDIGEIKTPIATHVHPDIESGEIKTPTADRTNGTDASHSHRPLAASIVARILATLDARHVDCFRVLVRPPGGGALVAATPERLVRLDGGAIRCDALAGTVRLESPDAEARLRASDKDRREHAIVVDAIRESLEQLGASVEPAGEPDIKTLRHVLHLHTPIRASAPRGSNPLHLLDLAARLHPTPAVGGTPTAFALDWIRDHEPVPRGWYASPVGWFDLDGNGELAVAIRSGVLVGNRAHLWAGAGIVAGSDPDRELAETELKLRAMLGALRDGSEP